jgi:hypothetical protein
MSEIARLRVVAALVAVRRTVQRPPAPLLQLAQPLRQFLQRDVLRAGNVAAWAFIVGDRAWISSPRSIRAR